jgi:hypothetical protein
VLKYMAEKPVDEPKTPESRQAMGIRA